MKRPSFGLRLYPSWSASQPHTCPRWPSPMADNGQWTKGTNGKEVAAAQRPGRGAGVVRGRLSFPLSLISFYFLTFSMFAFVLLPSSPPQPSFVSLFSPLLASVFLVHPNIQRR
ncbi:hypothetical protein EDB80DRAFT_738659 [Ilyonectria destructans]|nr:hypothetical protein EDB80DRAFT_738659 [Ilyonectria destructans]